jgi:DUF4097 and DUF4098 domain-containing protein YvlB
MMAFGISVCAQTDPNRLTIAFSDPNRPGLLKVQLLQGSITVRQGTGRDVVITTSERVRTNRSRSRSAAEAESQGLRRLDNTASGLSVDESNNTMTVSTGSWNQSVNLEIQVPARTNLQLKTVNGGNLLVEGVDGDLDVQNDNGDVTLTDVAGSVVAHSLNGEVKVTMKRLTPQKAMSFTSLNGRVDVTLPADLKANVKMRTDNGEIWTDFDVQVRANPSTAASTVDNRSRGGRLRIEIDRSIFGTINGGGPDFTFQTLNGNIYIRKLK